MIRWREAKREDVPAVVALLVEDALGATRESDDMALYYAAFDAMSYEYGNTLIVGEADGRVVATYQLTFITGLSLRASRRAQVESVRVAAKLRSEGVGAALMRDAEMRAIHAGCTLMQLTSDKSRDAALRFYERAGFTPSHIGFKRKLNP
ncbi:MAG: GNAT family N-acetyltransferase [Pseudorhodobacter sp.]|jgi:ribosomal protein S18 acetylase RimI-like enzyme